MGEMFERQPVVIQKVALSGLVGTEQVGWEQDAEFSFGILSASPPAPRGVFLVYQELDHSLQAVVEIMHSDGLVHEVIPPEAKVGGGKFIAFVTAGAKVTIKPAPETKRVEIDGDMLQELIFDIPHHT